MTTPVSEPPLCPDLDTLPLATTRWGTGPARVLLIHGIGDGTFSWVGFIPYLRAQLGGICVDLRGHGNSPWDPLQCYDTAVLAADVIQLIETLDLTSLVLVGHSLGAEVATRIAAARRARIAGLVLVEGGPDLDQEATHLLRQQMIAAPRKYDSLAQLEAVLEERYPLVDPATLRLYAAEAVRPTPSGHLELKHDPAFLRGVQLMDTREYWSQLTGVSCPILLIRGQFSSLLTRAKTTAFPKRRPNCQSVELPGAGHAVPLENPAALHAALAAWLRSLPMHG